MWTVIVALIFFIVPFAPFFILYQMGFRKILLIPAAILPLLALFMYFTVCLALNWFIFGNDWTVPGYHPSMINLMKVPNFSGGLTLLVTPYIEGFNLLHMLLSVTIYSKNWLLWTMDFIGIVAYVRYVLVGLIIPALFSGWGYQEPDYEPVKKEQTVEEMWREAQKQK